MGVLFAVVLTTIAAALVGLLVPKLTQRRQMTWRLWMAALVAAIATGLVILILLNVAAPERRIERFVEAKHDVADPQFAHEISSIIGPPITTGNHIETLVNGDQFFPAMLEAIRGAKKSITFEEYIYWSGKTGEEFTAALIERAKAGVKVHVVLDWAGSLKMDDQMLRDTEAAGVEIHMYHPLKWYHLDQMNNRTHRKLLVVDGRVGFTGGAGIGDQWMGDARNPEEWHDMQFRLTGPAVAQMQSAFLDNWLKTEGELLHGPEYFPTDLETTGTMLAHVTVSSFEQGAESARLMFLMSIAAAQKTLRIANSYFVPDDMAVEMLVAAAERGVDVEIIVPGKHIDAKVTKRAMKSKWGPLLKAGVKIYEYQPTLFHVKSMIVDELWSVVGSTNFDNRSFRLNDENNLNVLDANFAREQIAVFEADKKKSVQITYEQWEKRPMREKVMEKFAGILEPQL